MPSEKIEIRWQTTFGRAIKGEFSKTDSSCQQRRRRNAVTTPQTATNTTWSTSANNPIYADWVYANCRQSCGVCDQTPGLRTTTTTAPTITTTEVVVECKDKISNCDEYQDDMCTNPSYHNWAHENCRHFCGFCEAGSVTSKTPPLTNATSTTRDPTEICFDRVECDKYDIRESCCGAYEPWARENCARYCKFCTPLVTPAPVCHDNDPNCLAYGDDLCTNPLYDKFVKENCAGTCKVCHEPEYIPSCAQGSTAATAPPTTAAITTAAPGVCADLIDCVGYDVMTSCCSPYEEWARKHCPKHCKFCVPAVPDVPICHDTDPFCSQYGHDLCTNPAYERFRRENCAGTCNVCDMPEAIPPCVNATVPTGDTGTCVMDGNHYPQGSSWDSADCTNHCRCINSLTNNIQCDPIVCPSPVPNCDLVHIPGHCCPLLHNCKPAPGGYKMVG
ncbi:zonadhesin-like [Haliotis rubra]|uniref:zonadhesin-like n=1 Tax=Haliotis rubra TaxID=36100 RepID=UPI001EE53067|nr:zonadhesin-like [Haliotis rubra]